MLERQPALVAIRARFEIDVRPPTRVRRCVTRRGLDDCGLQLLERAAKRRAVLEEVFEAFGCVASPPFRRPALAASPTGQREATEEQPGMIFDPSECLDDLRRVAGRHASTCTRGG